LSAFFGIFSIIVFSISIVNSKLLYPFNRLWINFGILLGKIVSPIVLGTVFFLIFTPLAIVMRIFGRDELFLNLKEKESYWKIRASNEPDSESFKNQF
tara:strand:- start:673 stop:966 length:294 start_codon:yes stop_codon:yes gene_type:complete